MNITFGLNPNNPEEKELLEWLGEGKKGSNAKRHLLAYKRFLDTVEILKLASNNKDVLDKLVP